MTYLLLRTVVRINYKFYGYKQVCFHALVLVLLIVHLKSDMLFTGVQPECIRILAATHITIQLCIE